MNNTETTTPVAPQEQPKWTERKEVCQKTGRCR